MHLIHIECVGEARELQTNEEKDLSHSYLLVPDP